MKTKETKDTKIDFRLTKAEKEYIKEYAAAHNMSVGELIRMALDRLIYIEQI